MPDLLFFIAWFLAGFVNGVSGMGAAMVAVPIIITLIPVHDVVPVSCLIVTAVSGHMAWNFRKGCRFQSLKNMFLGSVPGSLAGLTILLCIQASVLQLLTGTIMILFVLWQCIKKENTIRNPETLPKSVFAGFLSGVLNTSISFGNPPIGAYALHLGWNQEETVGTMNIFSFGAFIIACAFHAFAGLYTKEVLTLAAWGIPASMFGILCSLPVARRINALTFKRILLTVIACAGANCIARALSI
ncbi:MAG: sulfite exporter TauE/SafE family protein [Pseudomonadota bacterium]